jgi:hypothetical protein
MVLPAVNVALNVATSEFVAVAEKAAAVVVLELVVVAPGIVLPDQREAVDHAPAASPPQVPLAAFAAIGDAAEINTAAPSSVALERQDFGGREGCTTFLGFQKSYNLDTAVQ